MHLELAYVPILNFCLLMDTSSSYNSLCALKIDSPVCHYLLLPDLLSLCCLGFCSFGISSTPYH